MKIHLIGVGGAAMGNLAAMLKEIGHEVTGSDEALYPPMSDRLREWGIEARPFFEGNLEGIDLAIIGNVISRGNAEAEAVLNQGIPYMSMPEALFAFFLKGKEVIVAAGTHGKTTTAFLMDHVLSLADKPPGLFAGGLRADGQNGYRISDSRYFVIEGDEYDSAFFDKGAKFLHYRPRYLILTSVEYDHADIYPQKKLYRQSFGRLLRCIPSEGLVAACISDKGVQKVLEDHLYLQIAPYFGEAIGKKEFIHFTEAYGHSFSTAGFAAKDKKDKRKSYKKKQEKNKGKKRVKKIQSLYKKYKKFPKFFFAEGRCVYFFGYGGKVDPFSMIGGHNMANACGVLLVAEALGLSEKQVRKALRSFPGVLRRQQIRLQKTLALPRAGLLAKKSPSQSPSFEIIFIEDFAHHPTAVAKTIEAVRQAWPEYRIHALYEPRSATSHRNVFQKEYVQAFQGANFVYLTDIYNKNKVSKKERLEVKALSKAIAKDKKIPAFFAKNPDLLFQKLKQQLNRLFKTYSDKKTKADKKRKGEIILAMSNGGFGGIYPKIEEWLDRFPAQDIRRKK